MNSVKDRSLAGPVGAIAGSFCIGVGTGSIFIGIGVLTLFATLMVALEIHFERLERAQSAKT